MSKTPGLAIALALIVLSSAAHAAERDALNAALAQAARDTRLRRPPPGRGLS